MNSWFRKNLQLIAIVGVLVLLAGFSLAKSSSKGLGSPAPGSHSPPSRHEGTVNERNETSFKKNEKGERTMTPAVEVQRKVEHADESSFHQLVLKSELPVLVDFYADWCAPCRMIAPVLEELAKETPNAKIVKVNVDRAPQLAARYGVNSIPTLMVFKDGRIAAQHVGLANRAELERLLDQN
jgi:thioredoxin 1